MLRLLPSGYLLSRQTQAVSSPETPAQAPEFSQAGAVSHRGAEPPRHPVHHEGAATPKLDPFSWPVPDLTVPGYG